MDLLWTYYGLIPKQGQSKSEFGLILCCVIGRKKLVPVQFANQR